MCSIEDARAAQQALTEVKQVLDDKDTPRCIRLQELLEKTNCCIQGLQICSSGNSVVMQRNPSESWINTYNPDVIRVCRANMDVQFILDPYACVIYIATYMLKSEKSMAELLKQIAKENSGKEIQSQLRLLRFVFLNHREVSAQEAVYRILSLPLKQLSSKVFFVNTDTNRTESLS